MSELLGSPLIPEKRLNTRLLVPLLMPLPNNIPKYTFSYNFPNDFPKYPFTDAFLDAFPSGLLRYTFPDAFLKKDTTKVVYECIISSLFLLDLYG